MAVQASCKEPKQGDEMVMYDIGHDLSQKTTRNTVKSRIS